MEDLHVLNEMERKQGGNNKKSLISSPFGTGQLLTFDGECYCAWDQRR